MIIKEIKLRNFKNFTDKTTKFNNLVFIKGKNGSGKTTLALESILFALYGYTPLSSLKDVPTRSEAKSCTVEINIEHNGKEYRIVRTYPTKLKIFEDKKELEFVNASEGQGWINKVFGDRVHFLKFRIIDAYTKEANFLEEGQTTLKKIIFSISEDTFNTIRRKLNDIKREREIYNKDKAVVSSLFPSQKRLNVICDNLKNINVQQEGLKKDLRAYENELRNLERDIGRAEYTQKNTKDKKEKLGKAKICYTCKQTISDSNQKRLLTETETLLKNAVKILKEKTEDKKLSLDLIKSQKKILEKHEPELFVLNELKMKLQTRIKQKDYKYTDKDVLIVKTAIEELDRLSTYYLTESIKILEPIINDVLSKIGFQVCFTINDKEKFTIALQKEGIDYNYKDLSTGQKLLLQIAFKLALLMEKGESGIVVADEGMGSLDSDNLQHVLGIFENLPFQLFFIIHNLEEVPDGIQTINLNNKEEDNED